MLNLLGWIDQIVFDFSRTIVNFCGASVIRTLLFPSPIIRIGEAFAHLK